MRLYHLVLNGPVNGAVCRAQVEWIVAPTLQPGDVVIVDNPSVHQVDGAGEAIQECCFETLFLLQYSSDLDPIEQMFAKLKAGSRKPTDRAASRLLTAISTMLESFEPEQCTHCVFHADVVQPELALTSHQSGTITDCRFSLPGQWTARIWKNAKRRFAPCW